MEAPNKVGSPLNKITTTVQVAMDQDKQNFNNSRSDISSADSFQGNAQGKKSINFKFV